MTKKKKISKPKPREFFVLETATGGFQTKYYHSAHFNENVVIRLKHYLDAKDPYDSHEIYKVREVKW